MKPLCRWCGKRSRFARHEHGLCLACRRTKLKRCPPARPAPLVAIAQRFIISQHGHGITHGTATGLVLHCGHTLQVPTSAAPRFKVRCVQCQRRRDGNQA